MKYTNNYKLPDIIVRAVEDKQYKRVGDYSVTDLVNPPQIVQLKRRHGEGFVKDVSQDLWPMLGTALHALVAKHAKAGDLIEKTLTANVGDSVISGTIDHYDIEARQLNDWKVTTRYKWPNGSPEWEAQLNIYRWLIAENNLPVPEKIVNQLFLRDFQIRDAVKRGYPKTQMVAINWSPWSLKQTREYVDMRLRLHLEAAKAGDPFLPKCSKEEMWQKPSTWAVEKTAGKRALRVFARKDDAVKYAEEKKIDLFVVERVGERTRCQKYCDALTVCYQAMDMFGDEQTRNNYPEVSNA